MALEGLSQEGLSMAGSVFENPDKSRKKYTLRTDENLMSGQMMTQIEAPSSLVVGGMNQTNGNNAPVKFYRFTNNHKQKM